MYGVGRDAQLLAMIVRGTLHGLTVETSLVERAVHADDEDENCSEGSVVVFDGRVALHVMVNVEWKAKRSSGQGSRNDAGDAYGLALPHVNPAVVGHERRRLAVVGRCALREVVADE